VEAQPLDPTWWLPLLQPLRRLHPQFEQRHRAVFFAARGVESDPNLIGRVQQAPIEDVGFEARVVRVGEELEQPGQRLGLDRLG